MVEVKQNGKEFDLLLDGVCLGSAKLECDARLAAKTIEKYIEQKKQDRLKAAKSAMKAADFGRFDDGCYQDGPYPEIIACEVLDEMKF